MDGENNGKPYEQMDDLGVPLFLETTILVNGNKPMFTYTIYLTLRLTLRRSSKYPLQMHLSSFDSSLSNFPPLTDEEDKVIGCIKGKAWVVGEALLLLRTTTSHSSQGPVPV